VTSTEVAEADFERIRASAVQSGVEMQFAPADDQATMASAIRKVPDVVVMLSDFLPDESALANARPGHLRWVQLTSAGVNHEVGSAVWRDESVALTTASGLPSVAMAQYVIAMILYAAHHLELLPTFRETRDWKLRMDFRARVLMGSTLGLLGYGGVGRRVAQIAHGLGIDVVAIRRRMERDSAPLYSIRGIAAIDDPARDAAIWDPIRLHELLARSDFVVCTLPLTPATHHLIDGRALAAIKPGAVLINVSRGAVVDPSAVIEALHSGSLSRAFLDVFEEEPLPRDHPLWDEERAVLTPHASGVHDRVSDLSAQLFLDNLARFLTDAPLYNLVDRTAGY
jgi:phosphoglycerate dehydrogenase-like enzyme